MKTKIFVTSVILSLFAIANSAYAAGIFAFTSTNSKTDIPVNILPIDTNPNDLCSWLGGTYNINTSYTPQVYLSSTCYFNISYVDDSNQTHYCTNGQNIEPQSDFNVIANRDSSNNITCAITPRAGTSKK